MRKRMETCLICLAMLAEPVCHAFGLPHPEGLATLVMNHLAARQ